MNEDQISQYIGDAFDGVDILVDSGTSYFFYNPESLPPDHKFPFVTLVTNDMHDDFSNLNRPSVFRLNIGVSKETFQSLFGLPKPRSGSEGEDDPDYDFTALDQLLPHPVYRRQYWLSILNPSDETFEAKVKPLLVEAYGMAVKKRKG